VALRVEVAPFESVLIVRPAAIVAQTKSVPSKVKACPVVGTVASSVEVAPLERSLMVRPPLPETTAQAPSFRP
jgi:hypothetical protein